MSELHPIYYSFPLGLTQKVTNACRQLTAFTIALDMKKVREVYMEATNAVYEAQKNGVITNEVSDIFTSQLSDAIVIEGLVEGLKA